MHVLSTQAHTEAFVERLAMIQGDVDETAVPLANLGFSALQIDDRQPTPCRKIRVRVESLFGGAVEFFQIFQYLGVCARLREVGDQHAELGSPITNVVLANHVVPEAFEDLRHGVTNDGAAYMPHMHLFGEVGTRVIHYRCIRVLRWAHERLVSGKSGREELGTQKDVDESGPRDIQLFRDVVEYNAVNHNSGQLTRVDFQALCRRHDPVSLVITEFRLAGRLDERWGVAARAGGQRF